MKKLVGALVALGIFGGLCLYIDALANNKIVFGYNNGYAPDQPIPYSHELHAGKYNIDCKYCHVGAETGRHASVPSLNICMNCHLVVAVGSPHIQKMTKAYRAGEPIEWEKVHLLPDHVKFNHAPHVAAGKACQECHGQIQEMEVVSQYSSLSMGWCVNCHRKPENNAPVHCSTCHY